MRWPLGLYRVAGESMRPALAPGTIVIGYRWGRPHPGQIAVLAFDRPLIKRLIRPQSNGWWVEGDNAGASTDSRQFGAVPSATIEAIIIWPRRPPHSATLGP